MLYKGDYILDEPKPRPEAIFIVILHQQLTPWQAILNNLR
jgi:hypothetical protein